MLNDFIFKVKSEFDVNPYDFTYAAIRSDGEEVYLVIWVDDGKLCSEIYHEMSVEEYLRDGSWIIQKGGSAEC